MRKILSLLTALVMTLALAVPALAADGFSDVSESHWAYNDIMTCAAQGIITGYEDGTFRPEDEVSTVQFLAMMTRTFYADELSRFAADGDTPWYTFYVILAEDVGMSKGLSSIDDNPMNRYEMAMALSSTMSAFSKQATSVQIRNASTQIKDWSTISKSYTTYANAVANCYAKEIITGMSDGTFSGDSNMNRAQACAVIVRMMNLINGSAPAQPEQPTQPEQPEETGTSKLANGKDITTENVLEILAQIQEEYPSGTVWGEKDAANNHYYTAGNNSTDVKAVLNKYKNKNDTLGLDTVYACGGWAAMVSDRIFGQSGFPAREVTDPSQVRAGDLIVVLNSNGRITHVSIASSNAYLNGSSYAFHNCGGNAGGGLVMWSTGNSNLSSTVKAYTRYPE
ncbi:MAG: S-layer homology domain-containing protein [Oscillibacter sp.]|nr:S-layer homology domain-containing protein [Oscillibacter sp.]